jgi:hypothetical protein
MGSMFKMPKADNSAAMAQIQMQREETAAAKKQAEAEKRDLQEQMAAKRTAQRRGGQRALLSAARLTPETGLDETLGT